MADSNDRETVILLHGLYLSGAFLIPLQRRLERCGFAAERFSYPSVRRTLQYNARALQDFVSRLDADVLHLVGHSLGGLVIHRWLHDYPDQRPGRVVTLATPHRGSHVARRLSRTALGRALVGRSLEDGLLGGMPPWPAGRELGIVAGTVGMGVGWVVPGLARPNDGTVAVQETQPDGLTDYIELPATHTWLLFSGPAAAQVCAFLTGGRFRRD